MMKDKELQLARHATLRQLQIFEAMVRHNSFRKAAEELFLTQPTVSIQIKKLSEAIGLPLFEQIGKKIHLTPSGRALYKVCCEIIDSLANLEVEIADLKGLKQGQLKLAVITTAKYFTPRLLGLFCQRYPEIDISLKVTNREKLLERIIQNIDDLYILGRPPQNLAMMFRPFLPNPLVIIAPRTHPLVGATNISLQRVAQERFIIRELGSGTRITLEQLFQRNGLDLNVRMELGSNEAIKEAVASGLGLAILSQHSLAIEGITGQVAEFEPVTTLDVQGFPILRHWYIGYPTGKQLSVVALAFLEYLQNEGKQLTESPYY
nr:LysR family transcriptional regulator [Candidatus Nitrosoglobus terrae]